MKKLALLLAALMVLSLLAACADNNQPASTTAAGTTQPAGGTTTQPASTAPAVVSDRTLSLMSNEALRSLDCFAYSSIRIKWICYQLYEGLIYYNHEDQTVEPRVAESWSISDDGLTYSFILRGGVKFHNGDTVKASDVVYSYERAKSGTAMGNHIAAVDTVTATDEKTIEIKLKHPSAPFIQFVSEIYVMSEAFLKANDDMLTNVACGTGPYKLDSCDLNVSVKASVFADYYRPAPAIQSIEWQIITDSAAAAMAFQSGDLDYLEVAYSQYGQFEQDPNINVGFLPTLHTSYLTFNCTEAPFDDPRVRQAVSYLINREEVCIATFEGYADVDSLAMHPKLAGMPPVDALAAYQFEYNPEKGLALLAEAGFDTSQPIDLGVIKTLPESHYLFKPAQVIQANLSKHNVKVEIQPLETATFFEEMFGGKYSMAVCGGSNGADASGYSITHGSKAMGQLGGGCSYYVNPRMDELFELGIAESDPVARGKIYGEIMQILFESCPQTGLGHKLQTVAWSKDLNIVLRLDYPLIYEWGFTN